MYQVLARSPLQAASTCENAPSSTAAGVTPRSAACAFSRFQRSGGSTARRRVNVWVSCSGDTRQSGSGGAGGSVSARANQYACAASSASEPRSVASALR